MPTMSLDKCRILTTIFLICVICQVITSQAKGEIVRNSISALESVKIYGMEIEYFNDRLGLRTSITRSSHVETQVSYQFSGEIDEIRVYRIPQMSLMMRELIANGSRLSEYFDENEFLWRRINRQSKNAQKGQFSKIITHFNSQGKITYETQRMEEAFARDRARLNYCSEVLLANLPLVSEVRNIIHPDSPTEFRLRFHGCNNPNESTLRPLTNDTLKSGLRCLMNLGSNRQRDAQLLYHYLYNLDFTINCQEGLVVEGIAYQGQAHECPNERPTRNHGGARWPGMTLDGNALRLLSSTEVQRLIFHEALHNVGHTHGQSPEVTVACERCCFSGDITREQKDALCRLCQEPDNAASRPSYSAEFLFNFVELGYERKGSDFAIEEALGNAVSMALPFAKSNSTYFADTAEELAKRVCGAPIPADTVDYLEDCFDTAFGNTQKQKQIIMIRILSEMDKHIRGATAERNSVASIAPEYNSGNESEIGQYLAKRVKGDSHNSAILTIQGLDVPTRESINVFNDILSP